MFRHIYVQTIIYMLCTHTHINRYNFLKLQSKSCLLLKHLKHFQFSIMFSAPSELSSVVQSSADIDKEPNETSKRDSALTLASYMFPSNSSSNSSPQSTNTFENQTGHSVGCQRVRSNKKPQRMAPQSLLSSVKSTIALHSPLGILCVSSRHGNLLMAAVSS